MTRQRRELGAAGEDLAARWYLQRGYEVLARNWRCSEGELDLVLLAPDGTLVFSEVKTRRSTRFGHPAEAVTEAKQRRLRTLAAQYLRSRPPGDGTPTPADRGRGGRRAGRSRSGPGAGGLRFDVVSILDGRIEVREGAF